MFSGKSFQLCAQFCLLTLLVGTNSAYLRVAAQEENAAGGATEKPEESELNRESNFLSNIRQMTFEGSRSGEGYFSSDGRLMVFQSERDPANPFYQIYLMDRETGDVTKVSPGDGKTTCAWIHPSGEHVLFASTQFDPKAVSKQKAEIDFRNSGKERRYSWDYDEQYEIVEWNSNTNEYRRLTQAVGYDAECSYSPDGNWIVFASNREAYSRKLNDREKETLKNDPAYFMDLYIMRRDGSDLKRLTDVQGYDGGPFFSPDGKRICWRRFAENGLTAEVFTMNIDGTDARPITNLSCMSWAPFYHPSGDYIVFNNNSQGFGNFELFAVMTRGGNPVRVTYTDGFDALPAFTPDGNNLVWTSQRNSAKQSQLYMADWNDSAIRDALAAANRNETDSIVKNNSWNSKTDDVDTSADRTAGATAAAETADSFSATDVIKHVDYLCRPELGGRLTGTEGEGKAIAYVAAFMANLGLEPAGEDGEWFDPFPFTAGVELGDGNSFIVGDKTFDLNQDWRPLIFSQTGEIDAAEVVFAGYGIVAPKSNNFDEYDSYVHLDVTDKWVVVFRQLPMDITSEHRQHLARYSSLRFKATIARDRGAKGLIFVSGPTSQVRNQLVPLQMDGSLSGSSIAVISVIDQIAEQWFTAQGLSLDATQKELDSGQPSLGFEFEDLTIAAKIDVNKIRRQGRNVLGWLRAGDEPTEEIVIVGAHIDHLGKGNNGSSLAKPNEIGGTHLGADDNASGVAAMLEIAQYLASEKKSGRIQLKRDVLFAGWSGEEMGLLGSSKFADEFFAINPHLADSALDKLLDASLSEEELDIKEVDSGGDPHAVILPLYPTVVAALNLDMVGRLRDNLVLQGIGSSTIWKREIERRNAVVGLPLTLQNDSYLPTDASTFYLKGVPILSAFTGNHSEYHTPRDTPDLLNYEGAARIAKLLGLITRSLASSAEVPEYVEQKAPENQGVRARMTAYLGTIPDYATPDLKGVKLSGVTAGAPAANASVEGGDVIIELAGKKIENIYDYTFALEALKIGEPTTIVVQRNGNELRLEIVPQSRQ